jgi:NitT/TauT family transport system substrate-binding protein
MSPEDHSDEWQTGREWEMISSFSRGLLVCAALIGISAPGQAKDQVKVGMIGSVGDAPLYVALDKGFFDEANIEASFESMGSLARQIVPLSTGMIDVACGAISAGLYNAVDRNIPMKVVADKGRNAPGYGYNAILVRKDLYDSGAIKSIADLKGRTIATIGVGSTDMSILNEAMRSVGMSYDDIKQTALTLPNHLVAHQNKGIEVTLTPEPFATMITDRGLAVRLATVDQFYPNQQQTVMVYGGKFIKERSDVGKRFMEAYLRGVRLYMSALRDGTLSGRGADQVIASIVKHTQNKDVDLLKRIRAPAIDPDGHVNLQGMETDWNFLMSKGLIKVTTKPADIIDSSFSDAAVKALGPYRKP